jgi:hypothetical protein
MHCVPKAVTTEPSDELGGETMTAPTHRARVLPPLLALTAALCTGTALAAPAAEPTQTAPDASAAHDTTQRTDAASANRRAVRDPQTGRLIDGPLPDAASSPSRAARSAAPARPLKAEEMSPLMLQFMQRTQSESRRMEGGARGVSLTPNHLSSTVVVRTPDGRIVSQCVAGETEAQHRLHATPVDLRGLQAAKQEVRHAQ